ncbi:MAG: high frequency lysogenization protein HflD [Methylococcaceae bacterium]|nr:high frequency lysogenization protein HflD [Methylococcaceae bacterium]
MTIKTLTHQTVALAGLAQSVYLVQRLARHGTAPGDDLETCVSSIFKINSDSVADVYGGLDRLKTGFQALKQQLGGGRDGIDGELARYAATVVVLEIKLNEKRRMQQAIRDGVERASAKAAHFGMVHDNVFAALAEVYQQNISELRPRVMVQGEPSYLNNPDVANRIRTLLLSAVRSAVLWRQCGGRRWKILLYRRRMLDEVWRLMRTL